jgi:hypothetical protein
MRTKMNRTIRAAVTACAIIVSAPAHAQGWYSYAAAGGLDLSNTAARRNYDIYKGLYMEPGGELYSGTVSSFSTSLGSGLSMSVFSSVSNGPAGLPMLPGSSFVPGFPGSLNTNYARGLSLDPATSMPANVAGRLSVGLGGGVSMDFIGGMSNGWGYGSYFGAGSGFGLSPGERMTTAGAGFTFDFGRGGSLSVIGSVSQGSGAGFGFPH